MNTTNALLGLSLITLIALSSGAVGCGGAPVDSANPADPTVSEAPVLPTHAVEPVEDDASTAIEVPRALGPVDGVGVGGGPGPSWGAGGSAGGSSPPSPGLTGVGGRPE